ncbi:hypothetical protein [Spirosoma jeollabukense]
MTLATINPMPHFLQAGPLRVRYENGFLRYVSLGDAEILRMIYFAIRDRHWVTAAFTITDEVIEQNADSFQIHYAWHIDDLGIQMTGRVEIQGKTDGSINVDFYGKALNAFEKNRIGLCVLHPLDGVLGQPAEVTSPDGRTTNENFPVYINPHQPFLNIQTLRWQPASGTVWQLDFSGDIFEMEDQRNWTDASFKTYSTPNSLPFPVAVSVDEEFRQTVTFGLSEQAIQNDVTAVERPEQVIEITPTRPRIGVGQRTDGPPLTTSELALLKKLNLSHLRADVFFRFRFWQTLLTNAIKDAQRLGVPLELAVFFGNEPANELGALQGFLQNHAVPVRSMMLYNTETLTTSNELLHTLVPILRSEWPGLLIGGGTDDNFAELNRNHFDFELVDFVSFSITPEAHASDDLTIQENIAGQPETVLAARRFSDGKPIHISPLTLRPRFTTRAGTIVERLNALADPRQTTAFGADWTRQSLSALTNTGVASITYYQSHGPAGLVSGDIVYPVFDVFDEYQNGVK